MFWVVWLIGLGTFVGGVVLAFMPKRLSTKWAALVIIAGLSVMAGSVVLMPESMKREMEENSRKRSEERKAAAERQAPQRRAAEEQRLAERRAAEEQEGQKLAALNEAINTALDKAQLIPPEKIEIADSGKRLVVTFQIPESHDWALRVARVHSLREYGTKAVITVRNAELPFNLVKHFRVTLNGPSPGPGLIHRYGSARFSEGGAVEWEAGITR
jgi:hypothetical protein